MLKISSEPLKSGVTLRLEGRAVGPWVTELAQACEQALADGRSVALHLGDVEFLDATAVRLIQELRGRGVSIVGCSPFISEQLRSG